MLAGIDIGSSGIKVSLLDVRSGKCRGSSTSPEGKELTISSPQPGFAEQDPESWWQHCKTALRAMAEQGHDLSAVQAIGISYQMHGLVLLDKERRVLRPSIIWCDSRAVPYGQRAFEEIGAETCLKHHFNSPGNFTAAKLAWVREHEPQIFEKVAYLMLPGDYIAYKLTGQVSTTAAGLSEGILWDFLEERPAQRVLDSMGIPKAFLPPLVPSIGLQGELQPKVAQELGLRAGIPISYRAGDQQNNAFSLKVLQPGELAATAGTSGVVVGIGDQQRYDPKSRVNTFMHVNHSPQQRRYCTLLCVNGTGSLNSWLRRSMSLQGALAPYVLMNELAATIAPGSDGLSIYPYGNGAERSLSNQNPGASILGLDFNRHGHGHLARAAQEGIVFALQYGLEVMQGMGIKPSVIRAGRANMFLSQVFRDVFAAVSGATIELMATDGAQGAARAAGLGVGIFSSEKEAFKGLEVLAVEAPQPELQERYQEIYRGWKGRLEAGLS